ncbi:hypothetical protein A2899_02145 [Candidatus Amesbacteria bacterium RIFCSPLOWO2_01_FULL_49_25]|uniref:Glycosyltransferase RgtA/B/C/D-like domain-containing protein n=1 Tax=Candidatus Amesbacteria bacterium RIFCSPHIGHO2_01_FULL_48_32b TaxID=1797253 RepID=A0A1F4YE15_9BACT|nr:MAG: hypothetical protein A2876_02700 [Candidatus Amesbacteria bacterium RIFCSPHIGHO2_01_FULL_48_32b]OGD08126.1 MAG: hypothetical protein A2899_02145 [Candidatus Amesbacteria bacterium RIFCSPLOWO2_01_FULL_49_25]
MNNRHLAMGLILILAMISRGVDFGKTPAGITDDESSHGYNAYSLLLTGRDEYGKTWPILNRSFGTYSSSLYTYMTILPVKLFGLNPVSIRLPSLVSGLIFVVLVIAALGPAAGFVVAISPVFIFYSRAAFETNLALTLLFLGIVLAVRAASRPKMLPLSFLFLSLSAYAYQVERVLSVILISLIAVYYWKTRKKIVILSLLLALLIQIPIMFISFTPGANSRISTLAGRGNYPFLFLTYFSPSNLFSRPDPAPRKSFPQVSVFYWWMIIPFIMGIKKFISSKSYKSLFGKSLVVSVIVSPAIAAATPDYFSTWRALPMFLTLAWIISMGLGKSKMVYFFMLLISSFEIYSNLVLLKHEGSTAWGYQYQALANFVRSHSDETIVIDNARSGPIYIWLALYNHYPPQKLQSMVDTEWLKDYYNHVEFDLNKTIDNVQIRPIFWKSDALTDQILISDSLGISASQADEHFLTLVTIIPDINAQPALYVYQTHPALKISATQRDSI